MLQGKKTSSISVERLTCLSVRRMDGVGGGGGYQEVEEDWSEAYCRSDMYPPYRSERSI